MGNDTMARNARRQLVREVAAYRAAEQILAAVGLDDALYRFDEEALFDYVDDAVTDYLDDAEEFSPDDDLNAIADSALKAYEAELEMVTDEASRIARRASRAALAALPSRGFRPGRAQRAALDAIDPETP